MLQLREPSKNNVNIMMKMDKYLPLLQRSQYKNIKKLKKTRINLLSFKRLYISIIYRRDMVLPAMIY